MVDRSITLQKNGKIWLADLDAIKKVKGYLLTDVTDEFKKYLDNPLVFGPGTTLKDLLLLASRDIDFWQSVLKDDISFLKLALPKIKEEEKDYIDQIHFYKHIEHEKILEEESVWISLDSHGYNIVPSSDGDHTSGIDHQAWNIYLDKPLANGSSMLETIPVPNQVIQTGPAKITLWEVMRLVLQMRYETKVAKSKIEYMFNWGK